MKRSHAKGNNWSIVYRAIKMLITNYITNNGVMLKTINNRRLHKKIEYPK